MVSDAFTENANYFEVDSMQVDCSMIKRIALKLLGQQLSDDTDLAAGTVHRFHQ